jgi:hypothetical protein
MRPRMFRVPVTVVLLLVALAAPSSAQTARLLVTVIDDSGAPIPEARIQLFHPNPPPFQRTLIASYATDSLGMVEIRADAFRAYEIRATHEQFTSSEEQPRLIWPFEGDVEIGFSLSARADALLALLAHVGDLSPPTRVTKGRLAGRVVSATGEAVANTLVNVQAGGTGAHTRTAADGSYSLDLDPGTYRVSAGGELSAPISEWSSPTYIVYARNEQTLAAVSSGQRTRADIVLNPVRLFNVTVTVVDDLGQTVSGARVVAAVRRENHTSEIGRETGEDGSAKIGPQPPGPVELLVQATKDDRSLTGRATIEIRSSPLKVTMTLVASGVITGRVEFDGRVDPLHGSDGLRVIHTVVGKGVPSQSHQDPSGRVSVTGDFMVMHLLGEECLRLSGIPSGWRLREITYNGQDFMHRPFSLESGQIISGVVIRVEPGASEYPPPACSR